MIIVQLNVFKGEKTRFFRELIMSLRFIIVRHGETVWNKEDRIQGHINIDLTEKGIEQAKSNAETLKGEKIDAIYSSDLSRAIVTTEHINKYHKCKIVQSKNHGFLA